MMTDKIWKKIDHVIGLLPLVAVFGVLAVSANVEIKDLDLWLHLAMGKFIVLNQSVPSVDILSCSIQGTPWVNHEWFFQVIVHHIFNAWGADGLIVMQVTIVSLTMLLLLFLGYHKERQLLVTVILFFLYMVFQQRFTMRPDLYSLFFFSIYIFVLSLHIDKKWALPVLCIVQILWSNIHGFFFFGPLFVLIGIVSEFIKRRVLLPYEWNQSGRLSDDEYKRIKIILFAVVMACLINPLFVKGAWYPIGVFFSLSGENKIFFDYIQELKVPITWDTLFSTQHFLYYKILIVISIVSFVFNRRRIDISALLFWIVFLIFSLKASRNNTYFAFAAYLVIITNLIHIKYNDIVPIRFSRKRFFYITSIALKILFLAWLFGYYETLSLKSYYDYDQYELKSEFGGISQRNYPDKAADFLVKNEIKGNFFNDFNSGAYLLGRTYPNIKVFIDGRTEVYGGAFFKRYRKIWGEGNTELFEQAVKDCNMTGAFMNSSQAHIPKELLSYLFEHDDWHVVYFDYDAVIFLKDVEDNRDHIKQHKIDLANWEALQMDLYKLGTMRINPYRPYFRAYTLESLGFTKAAMKELKHVFEIEPKYSGAHDLMGKIYAQQNKHEKAFKHFRLAVAANPMDKEKRHNLALSYSDLKQYEGAVKEYEKIVRRWPRDPKGHFLLTKTLIVDGQYPKALKALRRTHKLSPRSVNEYIELGDILLKNKAYHQARESFMMALATGQKSGVIHKKLGQVALAINEPQQAKEEFEKALFFEPDDKEAKNALRQLR